MTTLLTKREAAARIGVTPRTLMRMMQDGKFPRSVRLDNHPLAQHMFIDDEVESWIAERVAERDARTKRTTQLKRPPGRPTTKSQAIRAAILKLDPENDKHWVSTGACVGQPRLSAVNRAGSMTIFAYADIDKAAPDLTRDLVRALRVEG